MLNFHQLEELANADTHLNNAALPTYSELLDTLADAAYRLAELPNANDETLASVRSRIVKDLKRSRPSHYGL